MLKYRKAKQLGALFDGAWGQKCRLVDSQPTVFVRIRR